MFNTRDFVNSLFQGLDELKTNFGIDKYEYPIWSWTSNNTNTYYPIKEEDNLSDFAFLPDENLYVCTLRGVKDFGPSDIKVKVNNCTTIAIECSLENEGFYKSLKFTKTLPKNADVATLAVEKDCDTLKITLEAIPEDKSKEEDGEVKETDKFTVPVVFD